MAAFRDRGAARRRIGIGGRKQRVYLRPGPGDNRAVCGCFWGIRVDSQLIHWLDMFAVAMLAVSGGLTAARRRMDIFGFAVIGTITGLGGGTVRDLLLGIDPILWVGQPSYIVVCLAVSATMFFAAPRVARGERILLWADALGLATFCVLGTQRALLHGAAPLIAVVMGVITATFGGMMRDVLCAQVPLIMRKEIYATAAVIGAIIFVGARHLGWSQDVAAGIGFAVALFVRGAAITFGWSLPSHRGIAP
jgi:uncharacterized membrane protein YeiH